MMISQTSSLPQAAQQHVPGPPPWILKRSGATNHSRGLEAQMAIFAGVSNGPWRVQLTVIQNAEICVQRIFSRK